jgi:hypothetical protein
MRTASFTSHTAARTPLARRSPPAEPPGPLGQRWAAGGPQRGGCRRRRCAPRRSLLRRGPCLYCARPHSLHPRPATRCSPLGPPAPCCSPVPPSPPRARARASWATRHPPSPRSNPAHGGVRTWPGRSVPRWVGLGCGLRAYCIRPERRGGPPHRLPFERCGAGRRARPRTHRPRDSGCVLSGPTITPPHRPPISPCNRNMQGNAARRGAGGGPSRGKAAGCSQCWSA